MEYYIFCFIFGLISMSENSLLPGFPNVSPIQNLGKISGVVKDAADDMIPHVTITFENKEKMIKKVIQTDDKGNYEIKLPSGTYLIEAKCQGYRSPKSIVIKLRSGETAIQNILFPPISVNEDP